MDPLPNTNPNTDTTTSTTTIDTNKGSSENKSVDDGEVVEVIEEGKLEAGINPTNPLFLHRIIVIRCGFSDHQ